MRTLTAAQFRAEHAPAKGRQVHPYEEREAGLKHEPKPKALRKPVKPYDWANWESMLRADFKDTEAGSIVYIRIMVPPQSQNPNGRAHHMKKHSDFQRIKGDVANALWFALMGISRPQWKYAETLTTVYSDGFDLDNSTATLKAVWDATQKAGVVRNDSCYLKHGAVKRPVGDGVERIEIEIREVTTSASADLPRTCQAPDYPEIRRSDESEDYNS